MALEFFQALQKHAKDTPDHPAIIDVDATLTYGQLMEQVERFAGRLGEMDLSTDSKLGCMCLNQREALIVLLAGFLKGVPVIPYNYLLTPEDLQYITLDAEIDGIVVNPLFVKPESLPFFSQFKYRVIAGNTLPEGLPSENTYSFEAFVKEGCPGEALSRHNRREGIPDVILYTSGTTARPKGVMLNESQFWDNTTGVKEHLPFQKDDSAIMALPLFHSFGNIIALVFLRAGGTLILLPQFQPKSILAAIQQHKATVLPLVPTIYSFLVQLHARGEYDAASLRYCISGGAALPHALLHKVEQALECTVLEGYGLTETTPVIAVNTMKDGSVVGSVGPVLPNVEVKIADEAGASIGTGEVGEILVKGSNVMAGYWKKPDETAEVLSPEGWLKTGDLGHLDESNRLFISAGRKKDLIIRAGENVSPLAIENVLMNQPGIQEAAAIGVSHERLGEQVVVCIVTSEGQTLSEQDIKNACRENLPPFMVPDRVKFYDALPKNPTGKVLKTQLREEHSSEAEG